MEEERLLPAAGEEDKLTLKGAVVGTSLDAVAATSVVVVELVVVALPVELVVEAAVLVAVVVAVPGCRKEAGPDTWEGTRPGMKTFFSNKPPQFVVCFFVP